MKQQLTIAFRDLNIQYLSQLDINTNFTGVRNTIQMIDNIKSADYLPPIVRNQLLKLLTEHIETILNHYNRLNHISILKPKWSDLI